MWPSIERLKVQQNRAAPEDATPCYSQSDAPNTSHHLISGWSKSGVPPLGVLHWKYGISWCHRARIHTLMIKAT
jgi:hypothetical protein